MRSITTLWCRQIWDDLGRPPRGKNPAHRGSLLLTTREGRVTRWPQLQGWPDPCDPPLLQPGVSEQRQPAPGPLCNRFTPLCFAGVGGHLVRLRARSDMLWRYAIIGRLGVPPLSPPLPVRESLATFPGAPHLASKAWASLRKRNTQAARACPSMLFCAARAALCFLICLQSCEPPQPQQYNPQLPLPLDYTTQVLLPLVRLRTTPHKCQPVLSVSSPVSGPKCQRPRPGGLPAAQPTPAAAAPPAPPLVLNAIPQFLVTSYCTPNTDLQAQMCWGDYKTGGTACTTMVVWLYGGARLCLKRCVGIIKTYNVRSPYVIPSVFHSAQWRFLCHFFLNSRRRSGGCSSAVRWGWAGSKSL
eukprot:gene16736-biopygen15843